MNVEVIVVGGGMAGMSCAKKLYDEGRDVLLITDELGGRTCYDAELDNNFGAVFFMENYVHAKKLLKDKGLLEVSLGSLMLHTSPTKVFKGLSFTMIRSLGQFNKFKKFMNTQFMPEYLAYKKDCETMPVPQAFEAHPMIKKYYYMKADKLIDELGIGRIADNFISKFAYACTGSRIKDLNALDFLNVAQGVVVPIHNFSFSREEFTASIGGKIAMGKVVAVEQSGNRWAVTTDDGMTRTCANVVMATTALTTQKLLHTGEVRQPAMLVSYLISGAPNADIARASAHYYGDAFDVIAIAQRPDGLWNIFSRKEIDLGEFFDSYEIKRYRVWPEALYTYGDVIMKQDWAPGCYIAGDMNGLGLEPACISGIYAANRILGIA